MYWDSEATSRGRPPPSSSSNRPAHYPVPTPMAAVTLGGMRLLPPSSAPGKPKHEPEDSQFKHYEPIHGSAYPSALPPAGESQMQVEDKVSPWYTDRIHEQAPTIPVRRSSRQEENTSGVAPVAGRGVGESISRPLRPRLPRREEPTYGVPPATTNTVWVDQPPSFTPARNSQRHDGPIQTIPPVVRRNVSESAHEYPPVNLGVHWREEPTYGVYPATTPTIRVDQPVPPSLHGRSSRHEAPIVSVPAPVGSSVGETVREHEYLPAPTRLPRRRSVRREEPNPSIPPIARSVSESTAVHHPPRRRMARHEGPIPNAPPVANRIISEPLSPPHDQRSWPAPASPRSTVPDVVTYVPPPVPPQVYQPPPSHLPSELIPDIIDPPISEINGSLAITLAERIPYISPVASLLEALTTQNASEVKLHQETWDLVNNKLGKVSRLVNDVVTTCVNNHLEENDLPRSLRTVFRSLESQLGSIGRAMKQSKNAGVIKRVFLGAYSQRKVKAHDAELSNVLQSFQAALAFNPFFVQFAAQIEVKVTNVNVRYDEDQTPLHVASQLGHVRVMRSLISQGADPNAENEEKETPLFLVSKNGNEQATRLLLRRSARVNHQDREKRTPLHGASENGHDSVTRLLLKYQADSNAKNVYNWTPLHLASRTGKNAVVRVLLRWRADIDAPNDFGWTPLHMAAQKGHRQVVKLLLSKHAVADALEARGETALHLAAYYGHTAIVDLLINYGADVRIRTKERKTALDIARREGHEDVIQLLEARS